MATTNIRFISDIEAEINALEEGLRVIELRMRRQKEAVKSAIFEVDTSDIKSSPKIKTARELSQKSIKALREQSSLIEQLRLTLDSLDTLTARLTAQFPEDGKEVRSAMLSLNRVRTKTVKQLNEAYAANQELAKTRIPDAMTSMVEAVAKILERTISYESTQTFVHIFEAATTKNICLAHYFHLQQCVAEDGENVPALFVVVTYDTSTKALYLNTSRTFDHPTEDLMVREVKTAVQAATALRVLLHMDSFANSIGDIPIQLVVAPDKIQRELFSAHQYIKKFEVDEATGAFIFHMKPTVRDREDAQRIMNQLYLDIKGMQRKSTATLKSSLTQKNKVWRAMFILNTANSRLRATPDDLDFMKTSYGLTDTDVNRVLRIINNK